jgi:hypothetical protein
MMRQRPIVRTRNPIRVMRRRRRWDRISWWYSAILVVPILLILGDWLFGIGPDDDNGSSAKTIAAITVNVTDASTTQPIAGAFVGAGDVTASTNQDGEATINIPDGVSVVTVSSAGYQSVYGAIDGTTGAQQDVALKPSGTGESAQVTSPTEAPTEDAGGGDTGGTDAGPTETPEPEVTPTEAAAAEGELSGKVVNADGDPIEDASVSIGDASARTKDDGSFTLEGAPASGDLLVWASGYADKHVSLPADSTDEIQLDRFDVKAIYLTGVNAGDEDIVDQIIQIADDTEINAVVVDIKENYVWYNTDVQFFRDVEAVDPAYDPKALVEKLHEHGIYVIARSVVFNDPLVAEARPDLAVADENGGVWRGADGGAWVNPMNRDLWQPNIDLAKEAASFGFDEIQYDYIRFPSDGDLTTADFGPGYDDEDTRVQTIVDFLQESRDQLPPNVKLAADVFGIVAVYGDDQGIGQRFADVAQVLDYICPMVYPSHFDETSIDVGGNPDDFPKETIDLSIGLAMEKIPGMELKVRPWLQDFELGRPYTADDVRAQIDASEEQGASGWMLWNAANEYTVDALDSE